MKRSFLIPFNVFVAAQFFFAPAQMMRKGFSILRGRNVLDTENMVSNIEIMFRFN